MAFSSTHSLREVPNAQSFKKGDYLVLFGELFQRGYANGLVEEAEKNGLRIIYSTVGRREKSGELRALTQSEISESHKLFINIPLEAGFDLEKAPSTGLSPVDQLAEVKLSEWETASLNTEALDESYKMGTLSFKNRVTQYMNELSKIIEPGYNVLFAHLMAGGVPRAKVVMPLMNRAFKGSGDRYIPSKKFWESSIGQYCAKSFNAVTAETLEHLIELSAGIREQVKTGGAETSYLAYGYHGTEILIDGKLQWQSYTPYLQGWAKIQLEKISEKYFQQDIKTCVYNCPEILTNSSSIFQGVEVSLYPLLKKLELSQNKASQSVIENCKSLLKTPNLNEIYRITSDYFKSQCVLPMRNDQTWPHHSTQEQMELMLSISDSLYELHADQKKLVTSVLSEVVFKACGYVMLHNSIKPASPISWINHDLIAKTYEATMLE